MIYSTYYDDLSLSQFLYRKECRLRYLIATSYTVDCQTLISLCSAIYGALSVGNSDLGQPSAYEIGNPPLVDVCLEFDEIKQCAAEHLRLYTQYPPDNADMPAVLYENGIELFHVCGKVLKQAHIFHPKILLAVFDHGDQLEFKLQVGSKNLTASNALDLAVCLESSQRPPSPDTLPNGSQLAQFFQNNQIQLPSGVFQALKNTEFQVLGGHSNEMKVSNIVFAYSDQHCTLSDILHDDTRLQPPIGPVHVFSPFLQPDNSGGFWGEDLGNDVIYHTNLTKTLLAQREKTPLSNLYVAKANQRFYHGKLIMWPVARKEAENSCEETFRMWVGSANATQNGMTKNSELMVGFQMNVTNARIAMENRYPNYYAGLSRPTHMLIGHDGERIALNNSISFLQISSASLSEVDCFPENQGHILRYVLRHISLHADLMGQVPVVKMRLSGKWPIDPKYMVCLLHGERQLCTLQHRNSTCCCAEEEFPPNGVYKICILDDHASPILQTYMQAVKEAHVKSKLRFPEPTPMTDLLSEVTALQVIPNCAVRGFSRSSDDVYQRLRAFLCSHHWDGSPEHPAFKRLKNRMDKVADCLADGTGKIYMAENEKEKFRGLRTVINAAQESKAQHEEEQSNAIF